MSGLARTSSTRQWPRLDSFSTCSTGFTRNRDAYLSPSYNETQLRREFVDPFFESLGWDVQNKQGHAEPYKDVIHEDAVKVGDATKAPDYSFRVGGTRKFFVETKKPSVNLASDVSPAFQLRRYGWSAKLPLSVLTDFEEFAAYDCRLRPAPRDQPAIGRVFYLRCEEYADRWDEIAGVFSREAVLTGAFDKFIESKKVKKGTTEVDSAFLAEIESWRKELAQNLAIRNTRLSQRELNFAVQRIIDRIIFLRICEDRGIEDYGRHLDLATHHVHALAAQTSAALRRSSPSHSTARGAPLRVPARSSSSSPSLLGPLRDSPNAGPRKSGALY